MTETDEEQQAFPDGILNQDGMTLRDYFAAQAMQGFISSKAWHPDFIFPADFAFDGQKRAANAVASAAYKYANAMLLVRSVL